jgi:16S rRNA (adenine1518-N6/adenine1519-N6)-dimethyltransferase
LRIKPKKSLGQHFLIDPNIIGKIAGSLNAGPGSRVVEIGPGTGALTAQLIKKFPDLVVVEVDSRAAGLLKTDYPGLEIIENDILEVEPVSLLAGRQSCSVIGNLPYYITSPILFRILDFRESVDEAVFMMQKEVADRIVAQRRTKEYGILSVQFQRLATVKKLFDVSRHAFRPRPDVESSVVRFSFDKTQLKCSVHNFKTVVRTAFNQRRKKLSNALKSLTGEYTLPEEIRHLRAEQLSPADFENLAHLLESDNVLNRGH